MDEWEVEHTDEFREWYDKLDETTADDVGVAIDKLVEVGPTLGRPLVERIHTSKYQNMKELRVKVKGRHVRILFMFDPRRHAVLLLGGDKTGEWNSWYAVQVPRADSLYDSYLEQLRREGLLK